MSDGDKEHLVQLITGVKTESTEFDIEDVIPMSGTDAEWATGEDDEEDEIDAVDVEAVFGASMSKPQRDEIMTLLRTG